MTTNHEQASIMVPMTPMQARLAVSALRHAGREIHDKDENGLQLIDLADQIEKRLGGA